MTKITLRGLLARKLRLALTALAVVLGVTFVTGTLVLTDTLNRTFDTLIGTAYQHVNFQIRGTAAFNNDTAAAANGTADRKPIPASLAAAVRHLPGVAYADGSVAGYAQFVSGGNAIGGAGSALGFSFDPNRQLSSVRLVQGRAPSAADDVVMDRGTATKYRFRVGDRVRVLSGGPPQSFTLTGIVTFGSADNLAGATLAGFDLRTAQALFNTRGHYDTINILAKPGVDHVRLQREIAKILPPGVQVVSGQTVASELSSAVSNALSFLSTALLVFALIALFVGAFTIFNTFSITVGQRTRELALLRVVGASRRQVFRSVLGEAVVVGLAASLIGLGLGVLAALALKALLGAFGVTLPSAPLVFEARTVALALAVGIGVTVISAIGPARRAVRIAPVAALVATGEEPAESLRRRVTIGGVAATGGIAALVAGLTAPAIGLVGLGAVAVFIAAGLLAPIVARPMSSALGRPLGALLGAPGRMGRDELDAQPTTDRPDRRRPDGRHRARVGDRRPRRLAVAIGENQPRKRRHRRRHHHRPQFRVQHLGRRRRLPDPGGVDGHERVQGTVRAPGLTLEPGRGGPGWPAADRPPGDHRWERRPRPRGWPAPDRHHDGKRQAPHGRLGGTGHLRPDRGLDGHGRRDLQGQPADRQLRGRRRLLRIPLPQSAAGRRPRQHAARCGPCRAGHQQLSGRVPERRGAVASPVRTRPASHGQPGARTRLRPSRPGRSSSR